MKMLHISGADNEDVIKTSKVLVLLCPGSFLLDGQFD